MRLVVHYKCRGCGQTFTGDQYIFHEEDEDIRIYGIATDMKRVFVANHDPDLPDTFTAPLVIIHRCEDRIFCPADLTGVVGEND